MEEKQRGGRANVDGVIWCAVRCCGTLHLEGSSQHVRKRLADDPIWCSSAKREEETHRWTGGERTSKENACVRTWAAKTASTLSSSVGIAVESPSVTLTLLKALPTSCSRMSP